MYIHDMHLAMTSVGTGIALRHLMCLAASLSFPALAGAVTIFRIGGESLPEPDPQALGAPASEVRFVQLSWGDLTEAPFGNRHLIEVSADSIRPQLFRGDENMTAAFSEEMGLIQIYACCGQGFRREEAMSVIWDGDLETGYRIEGVAEALDEFQGRPVDYCIERGSCKTIWFHLDGVFPLSRIAIYPPPGIESFAPVYTIGKDDGDPLKFGSREREFRHSYVSGTPPLFDFDVLAEELENRDNELVFEFDREPVQNIVFITRVGPWQIGEFEIYLDGFPQWAQYTTSILDLTPGEEQLATLGSVTWSGTQHPGSDVALHLRKGITPDPNLYYRNTFRGDERLPYDAAGELLDRRTYFRLESGERGGIGPDLVNWSSWSPPVDFDSGKGEFFTNSQPREFVQFNTVFRSGGRLDYLEFPVTVPPVATRVVAEIDPATTKAREVTRFTLLLRPHIEPGELGFDSIEIQTTAAVESVESVSVDKQVIEVDQWSTRTVDDGVVITIPRMDHRRTGELIEIVFHARVFDYGTTFGGRVFDSQKPYEVPQNLDPGDAAFLADGNTLSVELSDVGEITLGSIRLTPALFTPNGDGINDRVDIEFDLVNLSRAVPVTLSVLDLSGAPRARLPLTPLGSGSHTVDWDGRDERGSLLSPGIYLLRVEVNADDDTAVTVRAVSLAY